MLDALTLDSRQRGTALADCAATLEAIVYGHPDRAALDRNDARCRAEEFAGDLAGVLGSKEVERCVVQRVGRSGNGAGPESRCSGHDRRRIGASHPRSKLLPAANVPLLSPVRNPCGSMNSTTPRQERGPIAALWEGARRGSGRLAHQLTTHWNRRSCGAMRASSSWTVSSIASALLSVAVLTVLLLRGRQFDANDFVLVFRHGKARVVGVDYNRVAANLRGDRESSVNRER